MGDAKENADVALGQALFFKVLSRLPGSPDGIDAEPFCPLPGMPGLADLLVQRGVEEWQNLDVAGFGYVYAKMQRKQITHNAVGLIQALAAV